MGWTIGILGFDS